MVIHGLLSESVPADEEAFLCNSFPCFLSKPCQCSLRVSNFILPSGVLFSLCKVNMLTPCETSGHILGTPVSRPTESENPLEGRMLSLSAQTLSSSFPFSEALWQVQLQSHDRNGITRLTNRLVLHIRSHWQLIQPCPGAHI